MKTITELSNYPNLTPEEIVRLGIPLADDALERFMAESVKAMRNQVKDEYEQKIDSLVESTKALIEESFEYLEEKITELT